MKDKIGKTVLNVFMEIVNESNRKPKKLWVDREREFCNKLMQEWLDNNGILMYSTHNKVKSVIAERFIKTLKSKIYKKITANDSKSYLSYLNRLVDQYNNTYQCYINNKTSNGKYSALPEKIETNPKAPKFKVMIELELLSIKIFLVKVILKSGQEKYLSVLFWKLISGLKNLKI